jgi:hypothetical protein
MRRRVLTRTIVTLAVASLSLFAFTPVSSGKDAAPTTQNCNPNYSGCVPNDPVDVDCFGGAGDGPAFTAETRVIGSDVYGLDEDGDGVGCEGAEVPPPEADTAPVPAAPSRARPTQTG